MGKINKEFKHTKINRKRAAELLNIPCTMKEYKKHFEYTLSTAHDWEASIFWGELRKVADCYKIPGTYKYIITDIIEGKEESKGIVKQQIGKHYFWRPLEIQGYSLPSKPDNIKGVSEEEHKKQQEVSKYGIDYLSAVRWFLKDTKENGLNKDPWKQWWSFKDFVQIYFGMPLDNLLFSLPSGLYKSNNKVDVKETDACRKYVERIFDLASKELRHNLSPNLIVLRKNYITKLTNRVMNRMFTKDRHALKRKKVYGVTIDEQILLVTDGKYCLATEYQLKWMLPKMKTKEAALCPGIREKIIKEFNQTFCTKFGGRVYRFNFKGMEEVPMKDVNLGRMVIFNSLYENVWEVLKKDYRDMGPTDDVRIVDRLILEGWEEGYLKMIESKNREG